MKKFYKENRVFVILMGIALVCIAIIVGLLANYVVKSSTNDMYGNRLDGIKDVEITNQKVTEMQESILKMAKVQDVVINIHGKIVNFNIDFSNDATLEEVKNTSISCLDLLEEGHKNFYDLQFIITQSKNDDSDSSFPILGYMKAGRTTISWSNNAK